ncbi:hypothetical protein NDA15_003680 [Ustilago hordei]|nr:hypothetical protein NDA15_003680 [Ustilago hordei]
MRQTFQQWMVLLSALILLLLPALLCYAAPMDEGASSSSGLRPSNSDFKEFGYYGRPEFGFKLDKQPLPSSALDQHFDTRIHYQGTPVLFSKFDTVQKVAEALVSHKRIWLAGPSSAKTPNKLPPYMGMEYHGRGSLNYIPVSQEEIHPHVLDAQEFRNKHGENALYLRFGRPFTKREGRLFFSYHTPTWEKVKLSDTKFHLRQTKLTDLRNHLNKNNYLLTYDSVTHEHLGFALDKDGGVIFENLGEYLGRA